MPISNLIVVLVIIGVALYIINNYVPMAASIKTILNIVVVVAVCLWLLRVFGLWSGFGDIRIR